MRLKRQLSIPLTAALLLAIATTAALGQAMDAPPYRFSITLSQLCQESLANVAPDNYGVKEFFHDLHAIAEMPLQAEKPLQTIDPLPAGKAQPPEKPRPAADVQRVAPRFDSLELTWRDLQALQVDPTDEKTLQNVTALLQLVTARPQFKVRRISLRGGEFDLGKSDEAREPAAHFRQWVKLARELACPEISIGCDFFALTRTAEGADRLERQLTTLAALCSEEAEAKGAAVALLVETNFDVVGRENEFFEMLLKSGRDNVGVLVNVSELRQRGPLSNFFETARAHTRLIRSLAVDARDEPPPFWDDVLAQLGRMRELSSPRPSPAKPGHPRRASPDDGSSLRAGDTGGVRADGGDESSQPRLSPNNSAIAQKPHASSSTDSTKALGVLPADQRSQPKDAGERPKSDPQPGASQPQVEQPARAPGAKSVTEGSKSMVPAVLPEMNITIRYRGARFRPRNANDAAEHTVRIRRIAEAIETNLPRPANLAY